MKTAINFFLGFVGTLYLSTIAFAAPNIPIGNFQAVPSSFENSCGSVTVSQIGDQYPGISVKVSSTNETYDFPKLGELPAPSGWDLRRIEVLRRGSNTFCLRRFDEIFSRDASGNGAVRSNEACYDSKSHKLFLILSGSTEVCEYKAKTSE